MPKSDAAAVSRVCVDGKRPDPPSCERWLSDIDVLSDGEAQGQSGNSGLGGFSAP
jgi:hypothetical protein